MNAITSKPVEKFLSLLRGVEESPNGWTAFCPLHEADAEAGGHTKSLSVGVGEDGRALVKCFAGCHTPAVVHSVGMTMSELFPEDENRQRERKKRKRPKGKKTAEYDYRDADGALVYQAVRFEDEATGTKEFTQRRPNGSGGWIYNMRGITRILYRLPELIQANDADFVFIVEGEKKVEALRGWGLVATCNVGGAGKWSRAYSERLKGRRVIILPDNDSAGWEHAAKVAEMTTPLACSVKIVTLPNLEPKGDVVDWIAAGGTAERLAELVASPADPVAPPDVKSSDEGVAKLDPLSLQNHESRTDIGNGRRLIKKHGQDLRYCHPWGKWLVWDGKRWQIDDTAEVERRAKSVADALWEEMAACAKDTGEGVFSKMLTFARYSSSTSAIAKMLTAAASEAGAQVVPAQLDSDPWILNVNNGTVDLRTGVLRPHSREDLLTKLSPVNFEPDATCPVWEKFLLSVFGGDESLAGYVRRLCGYWVTGIVREQVLPILHGSGANGKTTFLNSFMDVMGPDYAMKAVPDFLMVRRNENHPTDKADLFGKRFVACSETEEGKRLAESMVKELTGSEKIRARRMREDFWEFNPTHKIALCTNHRPIVSGTDVGIWRRLRLIPFEVRFWDPDHEQEGPPDLRQDKDLNSKLQTEYSGILTWIVRGCIEWLHDGEQSPEAVRRETKAYRESQDVLGSFIAECCAVGEYYAIRSSDLYSAYKAWCETTGEYQINQRKFGLAMTERRFERYTSAGTYYKKITLIGLADVWQENSNGVTH
jgi:putative DNA primase/helicase